MLPPEPTENSVELLFPSLDRIDEVLCGSHGMLNRIVLRTTFVIALIASAVAIPACQTTRTARPEMLTGEGQVAHERHATGIDSQTADYK